MEVSLNISRPDGKTGVEREKEREREREVISFMLNGLAPRIFSSAHLLL